MPGRKTDVKDAEWIADLLSHGLLSPSFIPHRAQRELRELVRYRRRLIQNRAQVVNRVQKVLESANIKLDCVASDVMGASGQAMLRAMAAGEDDPEVLADLAKGKLRDKIPFLREALRGQIGPHQRFMIGYQELGGDYFDARDRLAGAGKNRAASNRSRVIKVTG